MAKNESLPVDIGDPVDVRAKLPRAREILSAKEDRYRREGADVEAWRARVALFEQIAAVNDDAGSSAGEDRLAEAVRAAANDAGGGAAGEITVDFTGVESVLEASIRTVNEQARPIRSREVAELLRASGKFGGLSNDTVSNALYYAAERAEPPRVKKLPRRGFYEPIDPESLSTYVSRMVSLSDSAPARG